MTDIPLDQARADALNVGLPKWPQMLVFGAPVTPVQALEIIRRTDSFFTSGYGGNDREWDEAAYGLVHFPVEDDRFAYDPNATDEERRTLAEERQKLWAAQEVWRERWGALSTEYVRNDWASCSYIGGPHGWCHPNGMIRFADNIGKWPSVEEVVEDWTKLVEAFPFLNLTAVLMSGEGCEDEIVPLVAFHVQDGRVTPFIPTGNPFARFNMTIADVQSAKMSVEDMVKNMVFGARHREHGLPLTQLKLWGDAFRERQEAAKLFAPQERIYSDDYDRSVKKSYRAEGQNFID